ncbi:MAG: hypothetical protein J7K21_07370 [Desulfurococcales archaeon]|nr:hypothetical protein [Desulfurococcales archaeon]
MKKIIDFLVGQEGRVLVLISTALLLIALWMSLLALKTEVCTEKYYKELDLSRGILEPIWNLYGLTPDTPILGNTTMEFTSKYNCSAEVSLVKSKIIPLKIEPNKKTTVLIDDLKTVLYSDPQNCTITVNTTIYFINRKHAYLSIPAFIITIFAGTMLLIGIMEIVVSKKIRS